MSKVIVVLAHDSHWASIYPVAVVSNAEQAEKLIKDYEPDPDIRYEYQAVEYIK